MKKFFLSYFLLTSLIIFIIYIINYKIDWYDLYSSRVTDKIIQSLKNNKIYYVSSDFNERKFKNTLKKGSLYKDFTILICGSSKGMPISSNIFKNKLLNLSVSSATYLDFENYCQKDFDYKKISKIVYVFEPAAFRFLDRNENFINRYFKKFDDISSLLSLRYFYQNIKSINRNNDQRAYIKIDGSMFSIENPDEDYEKKKINIYIETLDPRIDAWSFDNNAFNRFHQILLEQSRYSEIEILLVPYHSFFFSINEVRKKRYDALEDLIRSKFTNSKIKIIGSWFLDRTNCLDIEFENAQHPYSSCYSKLYN
jgi:hypothetical protein